MKYVRKMTTPDDTSEATKKALVMSRSEKERLAIRAAESGIIGGVKKGIKVKINGRTASSKALH